jgi:hypothetical protein
VLLGFNDVVRLLAVLHIALDARLPGARLLPADRLLIGT